MLNHTYLQSVATEGLQEDNGYVLADPTAQAPTLLRAVYHKKQLRVREENEGIFRFADWLPVERFIHSDGSPVTYRSEGLATLLGLSNLYITFNGYWPEKGANMRTGTFKECEAYSVCARKPADEQILVVSSAGNTARAFMKVASENKIPLLLVVPEKNLGSLWSIEEVDPCVKLIAVGGDADYTDAIHLADAICALDGFVSEGGAKNVARRDGMGTTVLSAATTIGEIPDYYFQAVGSGTGVIAAHEANLRLNESGDYTPKTMKLFASQNLPFVPMAQAWGKKSRALDPMNEEETVRQIDTILAKVLSNRQPPYGLTGGLYDVLSAADGEMPTVENSEVIEAQRLFAELEGWDICPEAGVALASLMQKTNDGTIDKNGIVMLNVTGGGMQALAREFDLKQKAADLIVPKDELSTQTVSERIASLYGKGI
ncbi:MAG: cysteate synthase [Anaerofustis sp.]